MADAIQRVSTESVRAAPVARDPSIDEAAREFEQLLVHRLLKDMRKTNHAAESSNARATWDDMYDQKIAGLVADGGGLGLQEAIARSLEARSDTGARKVSDLDGLDERETLALRALIASKNEAETDPGAALGRPPMLPAARSMVPPNSPTAVPSPTAANAQAASRESRFVDPLLTHATRNAERLGTTPDAILAIAALESGWGQRPIVDEQGQDSHNLFGIKTHGMDVPGVKHLTTEFLGDGPRTVEADFRRYDSVGDAVDGFADFLLSNPRYGSALEVAADPEAFLHGLQAAGYATDPAYADKAIRVMQRVRAHLEPALSSEESNR